MTFDDQKEPGFEYIFFPSFQGRGLATEAATVYRDHAFRTLGLARLVCVMDQPNLASWRVAEKLGMKLERETFKRSKTLCVYSMESGEKVESQ